MSSPPVRVCLICRRPRSSKSLDEHGACVEGHWISSADDEAWSAQGNPRELPS